MTVRKNNGSIPNLPSDGIACVHSYTWERSGVGWRLHSWTLLNILKSLPSICACVRQLENTEDEHSEYVRNASVRERIISKTSKSAEKLWLCNCRTDVSQRYFHALHRVIDKLPTVVSKCWFGSIHVVYNVLSMGSHTKMVVICNFLLEKDIFVKSVVPITWRSISRVSIYNNISNVTAWRCILNGRYAVLANNVTSPCEH